MLSLTRTIRGIPTEVPLGRADGLPKAGAANADTLTTVPKSTVQEYVCTLEAVKMQDLDRAIQFALDLP